MKQFMNISALILATVGFVCEANSNTGVQTMSLHVENADPYFVIQLGQGKNIVTEEWKTQCLNGKIKTSHDKDAARFILDRTLTESELESSFGFKSSAKAAIGLFSGSARASFAKSTRSSSRSITMVYKASVVTGTDFLDETAINWLVPKEDPKFFSQCGDAVVQQITRGGELYLLVRMDFASEAEKMAFETALGGSYGLIGSGSAEVQAASKSFAQRAAVHIEAYQHGGEANRLSHALNPQHAVTCDMANLTACNKFMQSALAYAAGKGRDDFPQNLVRTPAALQYTLRDWEDYNAGAAVQDIPANVQKARDSLLEKLQLQINIQNRYDSLRAAGYFGAPQSFRSRIEQTNTESEKNVKLLENAVKSCFDKLQLTNSTSTSRSNPDTTNKPAFEISPAPTLGQNTLAGKVTFKRPIFNFKVDTVAQCINAASDNSLKAGGYKDLRSAYQAMDVKLPVTNLQGRNDYVNSITPGIGYWGDWSNWAMCPSGQFAVGYKIRAEGSCGDCDDTALNAVNLTCANWPRTQVALREPHPGIWGAWHPESRCTHGPINGMQIRIEGKLGEGHDDTAANDLLASCVSGQTIQAPGGLGWGGFSAMQRCPSGSAVCGARIRIEGSQGDGDDTAMNGIELACCSY